MERLLWRESSGDLNSSQGRETGMTVRHLTGTLDVVGGNVVAHMSGVRGLFRKERWHEEQVLPISQLACVIKTADDKGRVTLSFQRKYGDAPVAFLNCPDRDPTRVRGGGGSVTLAG